ncbi:substrate-binding domain-containing protein [Azorhizophilus paspali]|uniref:Substrate-binding domain-containing protein n=1 Tax=Azorhizophilus paspali TaxID=69963 RepID=A0ABV6SF38_AZOPA
MKRWLSFHFLCHAAGLLSGLLLAPLGSAEPLQFALIAKRVDHRFFIQAGEGCAEAARTQGDTCLLLGSQGPIHFRQQNQALEQALARHLDGIALSVTHSKWLATHALQRLGKTPLITFDSDLEPVEQHLRKGHVGLDNLAFGHQLAMLLQRFRPQGGKLCILTDSPQQANHQKRIQGIRQQLRGTQVSDGGSGRLNGENGWSEPNRCPLYRAENLENVVLQLAALLHASQIDAIISTGSWPIHEPRTYRQRLGPLLAELVARGSAPTIVIATNEPDADQRALLDDGLAQAYLGMEGRETGRQSYWMLKRLARGEPIAREVLIDHYAIHLPRASPQAPARP